MEVVPRFKLWFEVDGKPVIGEGRAKLLMEILTCGSLSQAARNLGISYRHAYDLVASMNERCGMKMIESTVGGPKGGGTLLTAEGEKLVRAYIELKEELTSHLEAFTENK